MPIQENKHKADAQSLIDYLVQQGLIPTTIDCDCNCKQQTDEDADSTKPQECSTPSLTTQERNFLALYIHYHKAFASDSTNAGPGDAPTVGDDKDNNKALSNLIETHFPSPFWFSFLSGREDGIWSDNRARRRTSTASDENDELAQDDVDDDNASVVEKDGKRIRMGGSTVDGDLQDTIHKINSMCAYNIQVLHDTIFLAGSPFMERPFDTLSEEGDDGDYYQEDGEAGAEDDEGHAPHPPPKAPTPPPNEHIPFAVQQLLNSASGASSAAVYPTPDGSDNGLEQADGDIASEGGSEHDYDHDHDHNLDFLDPPNRPLNLHLLDIFSSSTHLEVQIPGLPDTATKSTTTCKDDTHHPTNPLKTDITWTVPQVLYAVRRIARTKLYKALQDAAIKNDDAETDSKDQDTTDDTTASIIKQIHWSLLIERWILAWADNQEISLPLGFEGCSNCEPGVKRHVSNDEHVVIENSSSAMNILNAIVRFYNPKNALPSFPSSP